MSARTQAKVLRVLESGDVEPIGADKVVRVNVRVVAATNRDLEEEIRAGRFREDLFYRLNVVPIRTPPLRERLEDVPLLVEHFARRFCEANNYRRKRFTPGGDGDAADAAFQGQRPRAAEPGRAPADPDSGRRDRPRGRVRGGRKRARSSSGSRSRA